MTNIKEFCVMRVIYDGLVRNVIANKIEIEALSPKEFYETQIDIQKCSNCDGHNEGCSNYKSLKEFYKGVGK